MVHLNLDQTEGVTVAVLRMESGGASSSSSEAKTTQTGALANRQTVAITGLGTVAQIRSEIDDVLADMRNFHRAEPDQVMQAVSAHGARLLEIAIHIGRVEVVHREWKPVREEADRVLGELKAQFQVASRLIAVRGLDQEFMRGQPG